VEDVERLGPSSASCVVFAAGIQRGVFEVANFTGHRDSAYFTGLIFELFDHFSHFWSTSTVFWGRFFLFSLFFNFDARVSNASKSRMMYCSSENDS
jgi:hypothetical protein